MRVLFILFSILLAQAIQAQSWSRAKVWLDPISESIIQQKGIEMDHGIMKPGVFFINDFDAETLKWMKTSGIRYDVLIDDVQEYYRSERPSEASRSRAACIEAEEDSVSIPNNFQLGSMGGFFTYEEFLQNLDSMHALYPNIITQRAQIDTFESTEGRPIYFVKISDNVLQNESEPELLYTSIHHAREPQSLSQLLFYMWYLLENYGSDDEVTDLIDNTQMYFIPMINPDGYVYNQSTDPNGGGMWRKNRRNNGDGTRGVDLNRNYGYQWGLDNSGSSPSTSSETYRGTSAFSEPETRAVKWLCEEHEFGLALNYHSFGNYVIYPPGTGIQLTPDSNVFIAIASEMTKYNNYIYGTGMQTVGYSVNGDSDDWMYGEQTDKNKIFSMTPEVGNQGDGFWPSSSRILPLSQENIHPNLLMAHVVGDYAILRDASPRLVGNLNDSAHLTATRLGLQFNGPYTFSIEALSSNISGVGNPVQFSAMEIAEEEEISFSINLDAGITQGEEVRYRLIAEFNGKEYTEDVTRIYGEPIVVISNDGNMDDFITTGTWDWTDEKSVSPTTSITDSRYNEYFNGYSNEIEYNRIIDLRQSDVAFLNFYAAWEIEGGWDYAQILASPVTENNWQPLCAKYSVEGNQYQDLGNPVWDGFQTDWVQEEVDLSDYLGQRIKIKFTMESDAFVTFDGFYFDDLEYVTVLNGSGLPLDTGYVDTIGTTPPDTTTGFANGLAPKLEVFPNPSNGVIYISGAVEGDMVVNVSNILGQEVHHIIMSRSRAIDLSGLPSGQYLLAIQSEHGKEVHRIQLVD